MERPSALWRVRGSLPVPVEADDGGLISRMGDVFITQDTDVIEESDDYLLFTSPRYFVTLPVRGAEFRREGIRGWRSIRYDLPVAHLLPNAVVHGFILGGAIGQALVWMGFTPFAYASTLVAIALLCWQAHVGTRRYADAGLRAAYLT